MSTPIILLLVIMVGGILLGFPIVWAMMSGCIACLMLEPNWVLTIVPQKVFLGLNNFAFLAIPCFLLCGDIMARGGLSRRLCDFCNALVGWLKGGLSIVAIIACAIFAAISGSAVATTAAIGGIMHPEMVKRGYSSPYSAALPAVAGTLGIIIPPSIVFVIYGNITGTSISQLLMAGVVPGVLCAAALCVLAYIIARRRSYEVDQMFSWRGLGQSFLRSVFALLMPLIILGGIYAGICTPTESSAIACLYGAIVCFVAYHDLTFKSFCKVLESTAVSVSTLMLLVVTAQVVGFLFTYYSIPTTVANFFLEHVASKTGFILITIAIMVLCGMFLDTSANNLILGPIFSPIAAMYGMDPVHFGLIFVFLLALGQATPPFGTCLFVSCTLNNDTFSDVVRESFPFMITELACIILFAFVPGLSTWLPGMMQG